MNKKIAIIGAGPAGLTAAYKLAKSDVKVEVFEATKSVGGMAKTISLWGQLVDFGPHRFFSSDPRVNKLWLEIIENNYSMVKRKTRIYYKEKFFDYPLKPLNVLINLGILESLYCVVSYIKTFIYKHNNDKTFEDWVTNRFGKRLFSIFFKSYSEKLWGISCKDLDADFASQRIKKLSMFEAIKSAILKKTSKHKTLVDEFAYPKKGSGEVYEKMAEKIKINGGLIYLNTSVKSVTPAENDKKKRGGGGTSDKKVCLELEDGKKLLFDHIISTMPLTLLVNRMNAPKKIIDHCNALKFRNTILVYLQILDNSPFPDQWIYIHSTNLRSGRITNFRNWVPDILNGKPETILCLEYWGYDEDKIWNTSDDKLIELATNEICQTNLVQYESILNGKVIRVPKCYPVYHTGYKKHLLPVQQYLTNKKGISAIGRYGSFKYNNQDHSILMGILAAENITSNASHNLWEINTDYEYQESCRITATGLKS